jgi:putative endonuclease
MLTAVLKTSTMYFTYILKSLKDGRYYYGSTENIEDRLKLHNSGKVRSTKSRKPFVIHYYEKYDSRTKAWEREMFFKSIDGYNWLKTKNII